MGYVAGVDDQRGERLVAHLEPRSPSSPERAIYYLHVDGDLYLRLVWEDTTALRAAFVHLDDDGRP
jgi:hypothetical protein